MSDPGHHAVNHRPLRLEVGVAADGRDNLKVRVPPERHRQLAIEAQEAGVSLNRYVNDLIAH